MTPRARLFFRFIFTRQIEIVRPDVLLGSSRPRHTRERALKLRTPDKGRGYCCRGHARPRSHALASSVVLAPASFIHSFFRHRVRLTLASPLSHACCSANLLMRCSSSALISSGTVPARQHTYQKAKRTSGVSRGSPHMLARVKVRGDKARVCGSRTAAFGDDLGRQLLHRHVRIALAPDELCAQ